MRATIHQPDFLPWIGLFNKISNADCLILLDHVENNPRDAAFWCRRVKILVNGQANWLSVPLNRPDQPGVVGIPIRDMSINLSDPKMMGKCLKTVAMAYTRAPFFSKYFSLAEAYFTDPDESLMRRNMRFIETVMSLLKIETKIVYSSSFDVQSKSTQMLVDMLLKTGARTYLCGNGAQGYQQDELFSQNGIALEYNRFQHPTYPQIKAPEFVPGLSILDALFMVGEERVSSWMGKS